MNLEQIKQMQERLRDLYPTLNKWWCWLFAYTFMSRVWWVALRLWHNAPISNDLNGLIDKNVSSNHFVVKYNGIIFDWHDIYEDNEEWKVWHNTIIQECNKMMMAVIILEWWWNSRFYNSLFANNNWEAMYQFFVDFESILDLLWVEYKSYLD